MKIIVYITAVLGILSFCILACVLIDLVLKMIVLLIQDVAYKFDRFNKRVRIQNALKRGDIPDDEIERYQKIWEILQKSGTTLDECANNVKENLERIKRNDK